MVSPDESAGTEKCFSEAQLKAMAGVFQGLLDKALTDQAHGGTNSEREDENAERDPPGEMVQEGAGGTINPSSAPCGTQVSPIGVIPKSNQQGKWRLIVELSSP